MTRVRILTLAACMWIGGGMAEARTIKLLALGDSLTAGWGLSADQAFPSQLQRALARDVVVMNQGISGDTTSGGLARLEQALKAKPDAVIVELGTNDALQGLDPRLTAANLEAILKRLEQDNLPVLLAGVVAPPQLRTMYPEKYSQIYTRLAAEHEVVFYPFFLEDVATDAVLTQADRLHPNAEGVAVIVRKILPLVIQVLDRVK